MKQRRKRRRNLPTDGTGGVDPNPPTGDTDTDNDSHADASGGVDPKKDRKGPDAIGEDDEAAPSRESPRPDRVGVYLGSMGWNSIGSVLPFPSEFKDWGYKKKSSPQATRPCRWLAISSSRIISGTLEA